jgi:hypothetical protein
MQSKIKIILLSTDVATGHVPEKRMKEKLCQLDKLTRFVNRSGQTKEEDERRAQPREETPHATADPRPREVMA